MAARGTARQPAAPPALEQRWPADQRDRAVLQLQQGSCRECRQAGGQNSRALLSAPPSAERLPGRPPAPAAPPQVCVRCEEINISGGMVRQKMKYERFLNKRMNTNPRRAAYKFRAPARILWRTVRGCGAARGGFPGHRSMLLCWKSRGSEGYAGAQLCPSPRSGPRRGGAVGTNWGAAAGPCAQADAAATTHTPRTFPLKLCLARLRALPPAA